MIIQMQRIKYADELKSIAVQVLVFPTCFIVMVHVLVLMQCENRVVG